MPIQTVCPECDAVYQLADHQAGKKVRCKNCQAVFEVLARRTGIRAEGGKPAAAATARRRVREDDDEPRVVKKNGKSNLPWIIGGAAVGGGLLVLLCGGVLAILLLREDKPDNKPMEMASMPPAQPAPFPVQQPPPQFNQPAQGRPVQGQPVAPIPSPPQPAKGNNPPIVDEAPRKPASNNGKLTGEGRDRVKHATVYLRVQLADGNRATGTGFFGCKEARNIVLTNAHVVGMLAPESMRPQSIEVIINSGEPNEWKTSARVLGVDRASDLAVLDIGTPTQPVPEPLTVKAAGVLRELDEVYVFGFPLGESLGKEITIRPASVSALRRKNGRLERVQVNGGMDPGNSGGPVVDNAGDVVGVAVSIIPGRQINFAIPGERVHAILDGRISELAVHQPYYTDTNKVAVPVVAEMIDPRNLIKEVGLEVWAGTKPANSQAAHRPPATAQPAAQEGDSPHVYYKLKYIAPEGKEDLLLPDLPPGKVYWQQAKWVNAKGESQWAAASPMQLPYPPVTRKPANLVLHYSQGSKRGLQLSIENIFKVSGNDDDSDAFRVKTTAEFTEAVASTGQNGTLLTLRYRNVPHRELIRPDGQTRPSTLLEQVRNDLPNLVTSVQLDRLGNILRQAIDQRALLRLSQTNPQQIKSVLGFHQMIQQGLESLSVALPPSGMAKPLDSWQAEHPVPIDTPDKTELGKLNVTFTYLGVRKRDGREEAVINMDGMVHGKDNGISGKSSGQILVDLSNGQTILAETTVKLQLEAILSAPGERQRPIRVLATVKFRMQRKM